MEPVRLTRESGVEPVIYFANSNIQPKDEYEHRLETLEFWAQDEQLEVIEGPYDSQAWEDVVGRIGEAAYAKFGVITHGAQPHGGAVTGDAGSAGAEGAEGALADAEAAACSPAEQARQARCRACYRIRFEEAAQYAADHGFSALGTTLSVSPYQYTQIIREELERAADHAGIEAHFVDYRPYYDNATRRSREAGMYRQNYCACRFSDEEAQVEREERKQARKAAKAARKAARAAELAAEAAAREAEKAAAKAARLAAKEAKRAAAMAAREAAKRGDA